MDLVSTSYKVSVQVEISTENNLFDQVLFHAEGGIREYISTVIC